MKKLVSPESLEIIFGFIGVILVAGFVLGLAESISSGAAGFWGGFPFWVICLAVLVLVVYDFWDTCLRKK
jgi:sterol desaturase/sphingolipid hydroxylase (fatty acid hydroxylase superfamily)|tara:strand:+ start:228 stop:437 length:210 start_codon:yes stop_codon:yes gene_type:complete